MKLYLATFLIIIATLTNFAQEAVIEDTSLDGQFNKINRTSTNYQTYKVISKDKFLQLKQNVLDSVKSLKKMISEKENLLITERNSIKQTKELLRKTKLDLDTTLESENSISLFGMQLSKITYNLLLWSIIIVLLLGLSYFVFKFLRSNILTKEAQNNLSDIEQEFEKHRKNTLEKEQKLRRKLQDEINKQRNS
ncbi:hypothetical protein [uncultured Polaribacter sp.]|uniref:hypothetical protein n=1 Tax=uncultured Polaribacter sp. TaxID=174711 RepID=UPI0026235B7A|nr:hypothetical protein [uncultured Polaribacter sp.]